MMTEYILLSIVMFVLPLTFVFSLTWLMDMQLYNAMKKDGQDVTKPEFFGSWFAS